MASGGRGLWYHPPNRKKLLEKNGKCNQYDFYKSCQNPLEKVLNKFYEEISKTCRDILKKLRKSWIFNNHPSNNGDVTNHRSCKSFEN